MACPSIVTVVKPRGRGPDGSSSLPDGQSVPFALASGRGATLVDQNVAERVGKGELERGVAVATRLLDAR
jgi:hypothetical protein